MGTWRTPSLTPMRMVRLLVWLIDTEDGILATTLLWSAGVNWMLHSWVLIMRFNLSTRRHSMNGTQDLLETLTGDRNWTLREEPAWPTSRRTTRASWPSGRSRASSPGLTPSGSAT